ncbi:cyclin-dependent kinase inhibitor 2c-related [Anaeramoeba flamelloides]|uniref:Cyclin-dependent kinase inhibitor 2c-related n=1 Tax=Anaeramoeba flamelloides TaxID=1746091 RepID=A0ABQ8XEK0_9EUKA|nr:cyclin-dependent kinase inhibitor 2c-related [Anaeramoeba flamelloides]
MDLFAIVKKKNIQAIKKAIEEGADLNQADEKDRTVLHIACTFRYPSNIIKFLIEQGCNIDAQQYMGYTPLHLACYGNNPDFETIETILSFGPNLNLVNRFLNTPLHLICQFSPTYKCVSALLGAGVQVNKKNTNGQTCLHKLLIPLSKQKKVTIDGEWIKICELLVDHGADVFAKDKQGITPIGMIRDEEFADILASETDLLASFQQFREDKDFADFEIKNTKIHLDWLQLRIGKPIDKNVLQILEKQEEQDLDKFLDWVYTGSIQNRQVLKIAKLIEIPDFEKKCGKKGLLFSLNHWYLDNSSKDFTIIVKKKAIKVHRLVLILRSGLFRGMFLAINESDNQIHEQFGFSESLFENFVHWLYYDQIDLKKKKKKEITFLKQSMDYYQLSPNNSLTRYIGNSSKKKILNQDNKCIIF